MTEHREIEAFVVAHIQAQKKEEQRWRLTFWLTSIAAFLLFLFTFYPSEENVLNLISRLPKEDQAAWREWAIRTFPSEMTPDPDCANDPNVSRCGAEMEKIFFFLPHPYPEMLVFMRGGIRVTILVTIAAYLLTLVVGLFGGLGRLAKSRIINGISTLYVEIVRGIPLLVQLIWWYFAFPAILQQTVWPDYQADPIAMSILGLVFCYGAYMSEIYRAGIQSIPKGQMEAALSLGMSRVQALRFVIIPQALRVILPPMGNEFIALLKDSSLVSAVAVVDLTRRGREYMSAHFNPIEVWILVALLYLIMTIFSARIVSLIERKTKTS
ncbi:MAG: amino acid ABC transporter permease [Anaerolineales bacterium]|nr:amino acid ABC transporter permease [Anaerolineales bacterium]MCX7608978.1 amino acid ABC transporter permease [Anaerolineales bacterium]